MEGTTLVVFILALMGFVCGGEYEYPKGGNHYPHNGRPYPPYPVRPGPIYPPTGPNYPFPGYPYPGADLNLPPNCGEPVACIPEICMPPFSTCPNFPQAVCVTFCGCTPRFFVGGVHVTPYCGGSTNPGRPHKKY